MFTFHIRWVSPKHEAYRLSSIFSTVTTKISLATCDYTMYGNHFIAFASQLSGLVIDNHVHYNVFQGTGYSTEFLNHVTKGFLRMGLMKQTLVFQGNGYSKTNTEFLNHVVQLTKGFLRMGLMKQTLIAYDLQG